jgi:hypothetical protein
VTAKVAAAIAFPPEASKARATAEATLVVEAPVTYFEGANVTGYHQEPARFSGVLYISKESKTTAPNQQVVVSWDGLEGNCDATTDAKGQFSCVGSSIPASVAAGSYAVSVRLKSGEKALGSAMLMVTNDKSPAKLKIYSQIAGSSKFPGGFEVTAQLTRETDGKEIDGREVSYTVNGKSVGKATTKGGWARLAFPAPEPRPESLKVEVAFAGDNLYLPTTDTLAFPLTPKRTQAYIKMVSAPAGVVGQTLSFQAKLSLVSGYGGLPGMDFSNAKMRFIFEYVDSTGKLEAFHAEGTTGADGLATAIVTPLVPCTSLRVRLESSKWTADDLSTSVQIGRAAVALALEPAAGNIGETVTLRAHATRASDNAALSGAEITFANVGAQSNPFGKATSDASGEATLPVKLTSSMGIGAHEIQITTPKTDQYNAGSGKGTIQIGPSQE